MLHHIGGGPIVEPETNSQFLIQHRTNAARGHQLKKKEKTTSSEKKNSTHHGSNSWIMLSNRITANNLDAKPEIHANNSTEKVISDENPTTDLLSLLVFTFSLIFKLTGLN
jgi:hypothetical protein